MSEPRVGYMVDVTPRMTGRVDVSVFNNATEGSAGWFATEAAAKADAADRMCRLAYELMRQAEFLRIDPRGT